MKTTKLIITFLLLSLLCYIGYLAFLPEPPNWTGFGESIKDPNIEPSKTLFDWLDLFIIPLSLGLLGWLYKEAEKMKTNKTEQERAQNETLNSFINVMTELLQNQNLLNNPTSQVLAIAKTRIILTLSLLEGSRKGLVLQFLYESDLINITPKLRLLGANFNDSVLDRIVLSAAEIKGANFKKASIKNANLNRIVLNSSNFEGANLSGSLIENTDFGYSNLTGCKLKNMDLTSVDFEGANLSNADLRGSKIKQTQLDSIFEKKGIKLSKNKIV